MITLNVNSCREFQRRAANIKRNELLPVLSNLKLELKNNLCTLTKNSLEAICIGQIVAGGDEESYLIDERIFNSLLNSTTVEKITVSRQENNILLQETEQSKFFLPLEPTENFPNPPAVPEDGVLHKFTKQQVAALKIALSYINPTETAGNFKFVHLDGENIFAMNHNFFYINSSFSGLPTCSFIQEEATIIETDFEFMSNGNHNIFFTPGYTYIFIKRESTMPKIDGVIQRLNLPGKNFSVSKQSFMSFINSANSVSESPVATCTLSPAGMFARLNINEANYNRSHDRLIQLLAGEPDEFTFNSKIVQQPFNAIPYETLNAKINQNCMIVQQEQEWFCFIGMVKQPVQ